MSQFPMYEVWNNYKNMWHTHNTSLSILKSSLLSTGTRRTGTLVLTFIFHHFPEQLSNTHESLWTHPFLSILSCSHTSSIVASLEKIYPAWDPSSSIALTVCMVDYPKHDKCLNSTILIILQSYLVYLLYNSWLCLTKNWHFKILDRYNFSDQRKNTVYKILRC